MKQNTCSCGKTAWSEVYTSPWCLMDVMLKHVVRSSSGMRRWQQPSAPSAYSNSSASCAAGMTRTAALSCTRPPDAPSPCPCLCRLHQSFCSRCGDGHAHHKSQIVCMIVKDLLDEYVPGGRPVEVWCICYVMMGGRLPYCSMPMPAADSQGHHMHTSRRFPSIEVLTAAHVISRWCMICCPVLRQCGSLR